MVTTTTASRMRVPGPAELVQVALPLFKLRPAGTRKGQMVLHRGIDGTAAVALAASCEA
jgi:hypothetical protein